MLEEAEEGKPFKTDLCVFQSDSEMAALTKWSQVGLTGAAGTRRCRHQ